MSGLMAVRRSHRRSRSCSPQVPLDLPDRVQPPRYATSRATSHHPLPSQMCFTWRVARDEHMLESHP